MMTPYDKLKSLFDAKQFLKPGVTLEQLDAIAYAISDNDAAKQLQEAKQQLFKTIFGQEQAA
jgi:CDP-glycerol glycerophosphotransferase (TagB/SpsB family)